jgi:hypothetical protein
MNSHDNVIGGLVTCDTKFVKSQPKDFNRFKSIYYPLKFIFEEEVGPAISFISQYYFILNDCRPICQVQLHCIEI